MNDYRIHRLRDMPRVWFEGLRLRRAWPRIDGTLGLWFCALPGRRTVSVSIWRRPEDLRAFVRSPRHEAIMRQHRDTGDLVTVAWNADRFEPSLIWQQALARLQGDDVVQRRDAG
jgi:hypothetical protein